MSPISISQPTSAAAANESGSAATKYQSNCSFGAYVLNDVRGVSADHDQLAVRHIDDIH